MDKFEDWLAPWEKDKEGKPLDEPAELDPARLKKHLYNLEADKERLQTTVADKDTEVAQVKEQLQTVLAEHETEEQRRKREETEREKRYEKLEQREREREKIEAIEEAFEDQGITPARAKRLAARVKGDDPNTWVSDARELVADGFKVNDGVVEKVEVDPPDDDDREEFSIRPRVVRSDGRQASAARPAKAKSIQEELDEFIPIKSW